MTAAWPTGDLRLERRYRRLLLAYPGWYRRRHGTEIVTTLLEMAEPGQRRPHRGDTWHLLASGVRQRFRLPARRPLAVVGAVLATLILAAFGAAAGSWLGWRGGADLPDGAAVSELTTALVGSAPENRFGRDLGGPWFGAAMSATADNSPQRRSIAEINAVLAARGWRVGIDGKPYGVDSAEPMPSVELGGQAFGPDPGNPLQSVPIPSRLVRTQAVKDGVRLQADVLSTADHSHLSVVAAATEPAATRPLVVAGCVVGGVVGWMLAAAVAYRSRRRGWPAAGALGSLLVLALPAVAVYGNVLRLFRTGRDDFIPYVVHAAFTPGNYYPLGPQWQVLALTIAGALLATTTVLLAYLRPDPPPHQVPLPD